MRNVLRLIPSPAENIHFSALAIFSEQKSEFSVLASLKHYPQALMLLKLRALVAEPPALYR
jgi:hypothetical protein